VGFLAPSRVNQTYRSSLDFPTVSINPFNMDKFHCL